MNLDTAIQTQAQSINAESGSDIMPAIGFGGIALLLGLGALVLASARRRSVKRG